MKQGKCKLCGQIKLLIGKSHIIPNFMYKGLKHENFMSLADLKNWDKEPQKAQTGFFDKHILCSNCDNVLMGNLERYAAHIMYGNEVHTPATFNRHVTQQGIKYVSIKNYDYDKFKLCILSMVWRSHISRHSFFKDVDIGNENEEAIRYMLLNQDAKSDEDFQIAMLGLKTGEEDYMNVIANPHVSNIEGGLVCFFTINGFLYYINLIPKSKFLIFDNYSIKRDELKVFLLEGILGRTMANTIGLPQRIVDTFYPSYLGSL